MVATFSGKELAANTPIVGRDVYTQTAGIHADGDHKDNLYFNDLLPERFGRKRQYALGKMSGKASIIKNLEDLGIELDKEEMKAITQKVIELGDKKETVTKEDLMATLRIKINGKIYEETASGDGQYDAFMIALWRIYGRLEKEHPVLVDYVVTIPPGGKTDALVECAITWDFKGKTFKTRGLDSDQTVAAIKGTIRMLNIIETFNNH